jgi:hypothetical protein
MRGGDHRGLIGVADLAVTGGSPTRQDLPCLLDLFATDGPSQIDTESRLGVT